MQDPSLFPLDPYIRADTVAEQVRDGYLIAYRGHTLKGYATDLRLWFAWLERRGIPIMDARRLHIETYDRDLEERGRKPSTRQRHLVAICGFYRYAEEEGFLDKSPGRYVRKPSVPNVSTSHYLERFELTPFLHHAATIGPYHQALCCLLALNGLRVSEAVNADVTDLAFANGHRTLTIVRKGGKAAEVPLAAQTFRGVLRAVGERSEGPLLLNTLGERMSRYSAAKAVRRVARLAGIEKSLGPHALRHTFVSIALDAGVPIRDVQVDAGHADVSTTVRYDRRGRNLDRHATYIVAAYAGG